jgi:hypothetical protein
VLSDQEEETVQHILNVCVFAWQFWFNLLALLGRSVPRCNEWSFREWWKKGSQKMEKAKKEKGLILL